MTAAERKNGSLVKNESLWRWPFSKTAKSFERSPLTIFPLLSLTVTGTTTKFVVFRNVYSCCCESVDGGEGVAPPSGTVLISMRGGGSEGGDSLSGGAAVGAFASGAVCGGVAGTVGGGSGWAGRVADGASGMFCWPCRACTIAPESAK